MTPPKTHQTDSSAQSAEASPGGPAEQVTAAAAETAGTTPGTVAEVLRNPLAATGQLLGGLAASAHRPDAVLYWGGLAGAAVLGAIEWPVAVALGVGVAIARSRATPTTMPTAALTPPTA